MKKYITNAILTSGELPEKRPFELSEKMSEKRKQAILDNIIKEKINPSDLIAFMDKTLLGNGKKGYALTTEKFYSSELPHPIAFDDFLYLSKGRGEGELCITLKNGTGVFLPLGRDRNYIGLILEKAGRKALYRWFQYPCDELGKSYFTADEGILRLLEKAEDADTLEETEQYYEQAAREGNPYALWKLYFFEYDVELLESAVEQEYPHAMTELAGLYLADEEYGQAEALLEKAARIGDGQAVYKLMQMKEQKKTAFSMEYLRSLCGAGIQRGDTAAMETRGLLAESTRDADKYFLQALNAGNISAGERYAANAQTEQQHLERCEQLVEAVLKQGKNPSDEILNLLIADYCGQIETVYTIASAMKYLNLALMNEDGAWYVWDKIESYRKQYPELYNHAELYAVYRSPSKSFEEKGYAAVKKEWETFCAHRINAEWGYFAEEGFLDESRLPEMLEERSRRMDAQCRPFMPAEAYVLYTRYLDSDDENERQDCLNKAAALEYPPTLFELGVQMGSEEGNKMIVSAARQGAADTDLQMGSRMWRSVCSIHTEKMLRRRPRCNG